MALGLPRFVVSLRRHLGFFAELFQTKEMALKQGGLSTVLRPSGEEPAGFCRLIQQPAVLDDKSLYLDGLRSLPTRAKSAPFQISESRAD